MLKKIFTLWASSATLSQPKVKFIKALRVADEAQCNVKLLILKLFVCSSLLFSSIFSRFDPDRFKVLFSFLCVIYCSSDGTLIDFGLNLLVFVIIFFTSDGSLEGFAKAGISVFILPYFLSLS